MITAAYGTAFTSYEVNGLKKQTKDEIKEETVSFSKELESTNESKNISYHTTTFNETSKPTVFRDPTNGKFVIASLEDETIDKLKDHFGESDIVQKEDGSIRLTGKAEAFVSGWFADVAYSRGFLDADSDHNGQLTEDEYNNTNNNFGIEGICVYEENNGEINPAKIVEKVSGTYGSSNTFEGEYYRNYREYDKVLSLDDELNTTLQIDKDFDGEVTLDEAFSTKSDGNSQTVLLRHFTELVNSGAMEENSLDEKLTESIDETLQIPEDKENFDFMLNFILDLFLQKNEDEQKKILDEVKKQLNLEDEFKQSSIEQFYTQENLEHILNLKQNNNSINNAKVDIYKREDHK